MRANRVFVLDDERERYEEFKKWYPAAVVEWCATVEEAVDKLLKAPRFDIWQLDFDLGGGRTGMEFCEAIVETPPVEEKLPARVIFHSLDDANARKMGRYLTHKLGVRGTIDPYRKMKSDDEPFETWP